MYKIILKGIGKRKVKSILNQWIKDQINGCLECDYPISFDQTIYLNRYGIEDFDEDGMEVDKLFKFVGNKI
jgi:hypothetical protein